MVIPPMRGFSAESEKENETIRFFFVRGLSAGVCGSNIGFLSNATVIICSSL
jgi:hypothetical protein